MVGSAARIQRRPCSSVLPDIFSEFFKLPFICHHFWYFSSLQARIWLLIHCIRVQRHMGRAPDARSVQLLRVMLSLFFIWQRECPARRAPIPHHFSHSHSSVHDSLRCDRSAHRRGSAYLSAPLLSIVYLIKPLYTPPKRIIKFFIPYPIFKWLLEKDNAMMAEQRAALDFQQQRQEHQGRQDRPRVMSIG